MPMDEALRPLLVAVLALLLAAPGAAHHQPRTLAVDLQVEPGRVTLLRAAVVLQPPPRYADPGTGYRLELLGPDNSTLLRVNFTAPLSAVALPRPEWFDPSTGQQIYTPSPGSGGGGPAPSAPARANVSLRLPWGGNATRLRVMSPEGKEALSVNLSVPLCGASPAGGPGENALLCPWKYPQSGPDDLCQPFMDGKCDPDCILGGPWDFDCGPSPEQIKRQKETEEALSRGEVPPVLRSSRTGGLVPGGGVEPPLATPGKKKGGFLGMPGFEAPAAVAAMLALLLLGWRRGRKPPDWLAVKEASP